MKRKRSYFIFVIAQLASDMVMINWGFLLAYWIRFNSGMLPIIYGIPHMREYVKPLWVITIVIILIMRSFGLYAPKRRLSTLDEFFKIIKSVMVGIITLMAATFVYREFSYSRIMLLLCWICLIFFISCGRFIINRARFALRTTKRDYSNLLLVGTGPTALRIIKHIRNDPHWNYNIVGAVSIPGEEKQKELDDAFILGKLDDFPNILSKKDIEEVILTVPSLSRDRIMSIILECEKRMIKFRLIADLLGMITSQVDMENIDGVPLLGLKETPLALGYNRLTKRTIDIIGSSIGLVVLMPLILIIALVRKLLGFRGPIFYLQKRIGEDRRRFTLIKFRTMIDKAEKGVGMVWAKKDDPRRTKIGTFLRRHNLDELPQLINVLKGEMSLVGPRPERPKFVSKFKDDIPRYMSRHKIKSGMTGWAQVNGLRGDTSIEERTKYDIYYVENWSVMFDIKILIISVSQTLFSTSEHAY